MLTYFPKYFSSKAISLYFLCLIVVNIFFFNQMLPLQFMLFGAVVVICFFAYSTYYTQSWQNSGEKTFINKLFWTAFTIRIIYVFFSYVYYEQMTGQPFEFYAGDSKYYHDVAVRLVYALENGSFSYTKLISAKGGLQISDTGYPIYLSVIYLFTGKSILIVRIIKALLSAWMCVFVYKLTHRNFGENTGRIAAIFCMLMPHFIYYCGLHLKETEMVLLTVAFIERTDFLLRSKNYSLFNILIPVLLAGSLFLFRTILGVTALMAFFSAIVFSSAKTVGWSKRILIGIWVVVVVSYFLGGRIASEVQGNWDGRQESQLKSLEWRASEQNTKGNKLVKYANTAVFLPMIFTMPFPTMINTPEQENQQLMNGCNYVKNITSFFTILGIILLIYRKQWRENTLILAFMLGYLGIIAQSAFAQSERFHLPSLPFALIIAAYGISQITNKNKQHYIIFLVIIFIAIVGWSWFKLAGRGLI